MNVDLKIVDWAANVAALQNGEGGWNVTTTGICSPAILGPHMWQNVIYNRTQVKDNVILDNAYAKYFSSPKLADRIAAWKEIEREVLDGAYLIKVSDRGSIRAVSDRAKGLRPYNINLFWDVWLDK